VPKEFPYQPATPEESLSRLAVSGNADPRVEMMVSKFPRRTEDGKFLLSFGDVFVLKSLKNFIVEDEARELLFMSYKSSPATVSLRVRSTFSLVEAFALAIGIVVGEK
jgi:hypothetical protein